MGRQPAGRRCAAGTGTFDALYPHYLCAMTDAALGETDRYVGEQAQYNSLLADLAAWLRRSYPTLTGAQWRW